MNTKRLLIAITLLVLLVAAGTWASLHTTSPSQKMEHIRLGLPDQVGEGFVFIALNNGYFQQEGLEVEIIDYPSGKIALNDGLLKDKVDIAGSSDIPVCIAAFEHNNFRVIANIFSADNVNRIIANKKSAILTPADLRGKRIATQKASAVHFFLHLFLLDNGIDIHDVNLTFMNAEELPHALAENKIDAFSMRDTFIAEGQKLLGNDVILFSEPGIYTQIEQLVASQALTTQRPHIVKKFLTALLKAQNYLQEYPKEALAIIAQYKHLPVDTLQAHDYEISLKHSSIVMLEDEARWALSYGIARGEHIPDFQALYFDTILSELTPDSVMLIH